MEGDSSKPGPYALRLKFPDGYTVPLHSHPVDDRHTLRPDLMQRHAGDKEERSRWHLYGGLFLCGWPNPEEDRSLNHREVLVQSHSVGPSALVYMNPADDPRKP
jgi:hypothetical protein